MRLEVVVIPVSEVDRAKRFYGGLGWRLDADVVTGDDFRVVQVTPPGSPCSIIFGRGVTSAAVESKDKETRYFQIHEDDQLDEAQLATWIRQAAALPGWVP